jgi:transcriptional regulator with XRE-family HTH domain
MRAPLPRPPLRRDVFSENLRQLVSEIPSVAALCRELSIHRSQFNRFLTGVSFPGPDILHRICHRFGTDARILLEPLDHLRATPPAPPATALMRLHPEVSDYFIIGDQPSDTAIIPTGIYRFTRGSFVQPGMYQIGLIKIYEKDGFKFSRGYMARSVARDLGLRVNARADREFRGVVYGTGRGVVSQAAHLGSKSCSFTFLDLVNLVERSYLTGFCARTMLGTTEIAPVTKALYERLPDDLATIQRAARRTGVIAAADLPPATRKLLGVPDVG